MQKRRLESARTSSPAPTTALTTYEPRSGNEGGDRDWRSAPRRRRCSAGDRVTVAHAPEIPMLINGRCHCGNIAFELEWEGDTAEIPARACGCSFCVKHGGVWTSNPNSRLAVAIRDT